VRVGQWVERYEENGEQLFVFPFSWRVSVLFHTRIPDLKLLHLLGFKCPIEIITTTFQACERGICWDDTPYLQAMASWIFQFLPTSAHSLVLENHLSWSMRLGSFFGHFSVIERNLFRLSQFAHNVWKYELVNSLTASLNTTKRQMTEMSQKKKQVCAQPMAE